MGHFDTIELTQTKNDPKHYQVKGIPIYADMLCCYPLIPNFNPFHSKASYMQFRGKYAECPQNDFKHYKLKSTCI